MRPSLELRGADVPAVYEASFWSLVSIDWTSGCWLWVGMIDERGIYGRFKIKRRRYAAHRVSYALSWGRTPAELVVRHTCDTPLCVNPQHLLLGTNLDNTRDMIARGRNPRGERAGGSRLTEAQVIAIRSDGRFARVIAKELGVAKSTINKIRERVNWRHVP